MKKLDTGRKLLPLGYIFKTVSMPLCVSVCVCAPACMCVCMHLRVCICVSTTYAYNSYNIYMSGGIAIVFIQSTTIPPFAFLMLSGDVF